MLNSELAQIILCLVLLLSGFDIFQWAELIQKYVLIIEAYAQSGQLSDWEWWLGGDGPPQTGDAN